MRRLVGLCLALTLAVALVSAHARAASGPQDTVRGFYATLLGTMQRGPDLGQRGRYDALAPAIRSSFDLTAMARLAVGPAWTGFSPAQQRSVTEAFARYTIATYADRFDAYSGEKLEVTGAQAAPFGTVVYSRIVTSNREPVSINYLMRRNGDDWQITDVYLAGTVSQVATLRAQFTAVLARQGVDGLVATLNRRADMLVANTAS
ncbi:MAG: ABC transporter substrate-binding protein [Stellaceae bacterium]